MKTDVLIIGAGLAGLSAARQIAAGSQATVILVERRGVGSNNPTPMTFADVPGRFGLESWVIGRYSRFTFHSPLGNCSSHDLGGQALVALDYRRACLQLLDEASALGSVWVYAAAATGLSRHGSLWQLTLNDGRRLQAPLVIDASGRGLFTSKALGLPRPRSYSHCFGARLAGAGLPNPEEAFFFAPAKDFGNGGGWLYPLNDGQVSVGYATLSDTPVMPGATVKSGFRRALAEFEPYAAWLRTASLEHVEVGSIPIYPLRRLVYDGLLIAGDAAGQATIWSCMGSEAALVAGEMAGQAALTALRQSDFGRRTLSEYQRRWDAAHRNLYRRNAWIAPTVWSMSEGEWNRQIPLLNRLTGEQMVARLRVNYPAPTLPQAIFVRTYDLAGRMRRGLVRLARRAFGSFIPTRGLGALDARASLQERHGR